MKMQVCFDQFCKDDMKKIACIALLILSGCASSPKGLEKPEFASSFVVEIPYQLALKRIVEADGECRPKPLVPVGQTINDVQNYPDLREAKIVQGASGVGTQIYTVITIKEVENGRTEVTLYAKATRERQADRLKRWVDGGSGCKF
ncbi:hypothetical protein KWH04_13395 [Xanthomonas campestris pv. trichodesmae]|nr:hypothetical protein [Xanthomonas citri]MBV6781627.1 hypothetical protein [Xanthomonas campestris pv. trichodesmae]